MSLFEDKMRQIPPSLYNEVLDFMDFLIQKNKDKVASKRPALKWAGVLKDYKTTFSSVQLQKESLKWR